MRSIARMAFDRLLVFYPHFDVVKVEWQREGPWLLVELGQASEANDLKPSSSFSPDAFAIHPFAILKSTGAVYGMHDGAVDDEPLLSL